MRPIDVILGITGGLSVILLVLAVVGVFKAITDDGGTTKPKIMGTCILDYVFPEPFDPDDYYRAFLCCPFGTHMHATMADGATCVSDDNEEEMENGHYDGYYDGYDAPRPRGEET